MLILSTTVRAQFYAQPTPVGYPATPYPTTSYPSTAYAAPAASLLPPPPSDLSSPSDLPVPSQPTPSQPTPSQPTPSQPTPAAPSIYPTPPPPPSAPVEAVEPAPADGAVVVSSIEAVPPAEVDEFAGPVLQPIVWYRPTSWFRDDPWDLGVELGVNGSTGTSESMSIRTGGYIKRKDKRRKLDTSLYYNKNSANGVETQSNALFKGRYDRLFSESPWTLYASNQTFYDEFQAFDVDVSVNTGVGYRVFDEEWVKLLTSFGAGASREFGAANEEWTPEAQFGLDWEQEVTKSQRFYAKVDYFPQWENFNRYRILTDMGMEFDLSCPSNVSLKVSATDRYDSTPDGVAPHNTNYSVLLLWKR